MADPALARVPDDGDESELPVPALTRLGNAIRKAREKRGLSQRALAEVAQMSHETLRRIEVGRTDVRYTEFTRLIVILHLQDQLKKIVVGQKAGDT
jgi:ribosome-binding protein aMBF1 (putative translation factor)